MPPDVPGREEAPGFAVEALRADDLPLFALERAVDLDLPDLPRLADLRAEALPLALPAFFEVFFDFFAMVFLQVVLIKF
jgi:hypothetical protein